VKARQRPPATRDEAQAREERRRRGVQVSSFCLQAMAWILLTFYATDYLPPLLIRLTVGLRQTHLVQYLVGYSVLALVCLALAVGFGRLYGRRVQVSRYRWRWYFFPVALALVLIPAQGANELLSWVVEAVCLLVGVALGVGLSRPGRKWRPARGRVAAP